MFFRLSAFIRKLYPFVAAKVFTFLDDDVTDVDNRTDRTTL